MEHAETNAAPLREHRFASLRRILEERNCRLFFGGQGLSLMGTWVQQVARGWLVYRLTDSPLMLGLVAFSGQAPTFFLTPLGGVIADRLNRRLIIIWCQALLMLHAFILAVLTFSGLIRVHHIILLGVTAGIVNSLEIPTRQAFLQEISDRRENLTGVIALNSMMVNLAKILGPSLAGVMVALVGEGPCFLLNGLSFLAVIFALRAMKIARVARGLSPDTHIWPELREGFQYALKFPKVRSILGVVAFHSMFGAIYVTFLPVFARTILQGNAQTLGFLMGAVGVGAISGGLLMVSRKNADLERTIWIAGLLGNAGLIAFSLSHSLPLSLVCLYFTGVGLMIQMSACKIIVQSLVSENMLGRVMGIYVMAMIGLQPMGNLLAGVLAGPLGTPAVIVLGALVCVANLAWFRRSMTGPRATVL